MTQPPIWVSLKVLLLLHYESISQLGGVSGVKDLALIKSALARPKNLFAYKPETDIPALAACYAFGLARNHGFTDGNKRAAFLALGIFLRSNGYRLTAPQVEAIQMMFDLAGGLITEEEIAIWVRLNITSM